MSVSKDKIEQERIARQAAIKQALEEGKADKAEHPAQPKAVEPILYPPLRPWERVINGRRQPYRPMTSREIEAENGRLFIQAQRRQDEAHAAKVAEAVREAEREQKRLDKKREKEERTGRRPMGKDTISLEEAARRGLIGSALWSPG